MRRWLIVMLLILLPYQAVWAGAAQYCVHEDDASTTHFGHHGHKHPSGRADKSSGSGTSHADCSGCHMSSAAPALDGDLQLGAMSLQESFSYAEPRYISRVPAGPERPERTTPRPILRFGGGVLTALIS